MRTNDVATSSKVPLHGCARLQVTMMEKDKCDRVRERRCLGRARLLPLLAAFAIGLVVAGAAVGVVWLKQRVAPPPARSPGRGPTVAPALPSATPASSAPVPVLREYTAAPPPLPPPPPLADIHASEDRPVTMPAAKPPAPGAIGLVAIEEPEAQPQLPRPVHLHGRDLDVAPPWSPRRQQAPYTFEELRDLLLNDGPLEPRAVLPDVVIEHFDYGYPAPRQEPVSVLIESGPSPFGQSRILLRLGLQASTRGGTPPVDYAFILVDRSSTPRGRLAAESLLPWIAGRLQGHDRFWLYRCGIRHDLLAAGIPVRQRTALAEALVALTAAPAAPDLDVALRTAVRQFKDPGRAHLVILTAQDLGADRPLARSTREQLRLTVAAGMRVTVIRLTATDRPPGPLPRTLADLGARQVRVSRAVDSWQDALSDVFRPAPAIAARVNVEVVFDEKAVKLYRPLHKLDTAWRPAGSQPVDACQRVARLSAGESRTCLYELVLRVGTVRNPLVEARISWIEPEGGGRRDLAVRGPADGGYASFRAAPRSFKQAVIAGELTDILRGAAEQRYARLHELARLCADCLVATSDAKAMPEPEVLRRVLR